MFEEGGIDVAGQPRVTVGARQRDRVVVGLLNVTESLQERGEQFLQVRVCHERMPTFPASPGPERGRRIVC